jgi:hypothetical protein
MTELIDGVESITARGSSGATGGHQMENVSAWRVLKDGEAGSVILAVDFMAPGREEATFADLAQSLAGPWSVWETRQPDLASGPDPDRVSRLSVWLGEVRASDHAVTAILGYCVGASYARAMADRVAEWQASSPRLLLFDPAPATASGMRAEFRAALQRFGPMLEAAELARLSREGERLCAGTTDLAPLGVELAGLFGQAVSSACRSAGIGPRFGRQVEAAFSSVMSYISGAQALDEAVPLVPAIVLSSAPAGGLTISADRAISFPLPRAALLSSPAVARAVNELIATPGGTAVSP